MAIGKTLRNYVLAGALSLGAGAGGVIGNYANAQEIYSKISNPNDKLKNKLTELAASDSLVITKEQYEKLPASDKARISPLYFSSKNGKERIPMYALPGFYDALNPEVPLFLKRNAQQPIGYFTSEKDSVNGRRLVYLIEYGKAEFLYIGPVEKAKEGKKFSKEKPITKKTKKEKSHVKKEVIQKREEKPSKLEEKTKGLIKTRERIVEAEIIEHKKQSRDSAFYQETENLLRLNVPYHELTDAQKTEFNKKLAEFDKKKKVEGVGPGIFVAVDDSAKSFIRISGDTVKTTVPFDSLSDWQRKKFLKEVQKFSEGKIGKMVRPGLYVFEPAAKKEEAEKQRTRYGVEFSAGTNGEKSIGIFTEIPLSKAIGIEFFANPYIMRGNPVFNDSRTEINKRESQLIGENNTYKFRTDEIRKDASERAVADIGTGLTFKLLEGVEVPLRIAANISRRKETEYGKATIWHERAGQPLGERQQIENSKQVKPGISSNLHLSAGARFNLTKNFGVGVSYSKTGKSNSIRGNLRVRF